MKCDGELSTENNWLERALNEQAGRCMSIPSDENWNDLTERAYRKFLKRHGASRREMLVVRAQFAEFSRPFAAHMLKEV